MPGQYMPTGHAVHFAYDALYTAPRYPAGHAQARYEVDEAALVVIEGHVYCVSLTQNELVGHEAHVAPFQ